MSQGEMTNDCQYRDINSILFGGIRMAYLVRQIFIQNASRLWIRELKWGITTLSLSFYVVQLGLGPTMFVYSVNAFKIW